MANTIVLVSGVYSIDPLGGTADATIDLVNGVYSLDTDALPHGYEVVLDSGVYSIDTAADPQTTIEPDSTFTSFVVDEGDAPSFVDIPIAGGPFTNLAVANVSPAASWLAAALVAGPKVRVTVTPADAIIGATVEGTFDLTADNADTVAFEVSLSIQPTPGVTTKLLHYIPLYFW